MYVYTYKYTHTYIIEAPEDLAELREHVRELAE